MNTHHQIIDWNAPDILMQIVNTLQNPLTSIMEANDTNVVHQKTNNQIKEKPSEIIFSSSQQISDLIKEVVTIAKSNSIQISSKEQPAIFLIYKENSKVQSLCNDQLLPFKISKSNQSWLMNFEEQVFEQIKSSQLNLYDLSYNLAISERQLHRKIKNLLNLTPNKYIRILKLHKAKELLDEYVYDTIAEVSYAVGYYDTYYFSKLFNSQYGITPKELLISKR
ncbi:hypothetical protein GCM10022393_41250 [Aquimarina addita]|uniref:HTH araC/xylS-type domain-containing protein n=1 Tax=Aquimarina addita TaxID=870485 RepID=A0ABP6UTW7_9FLAO